LGEGLGKREWKAYLQVRGKIFPTKDRDYLLAHRRGDFFVGKKGGGFGKDFCQMKKANCFCLGKMGLGFDCYIFGQGRRRKESLQSVVELNL